MPADEIGMVFFLHDRDSDGRLTATEFFTGLQATGCAPSRGAFKAACDSLKTSTPNLAQFREAAGLVQAQRPSRADFMQRFQRFQRDGIVEVETIRYVTTQLGERLTQSEVQELILLIDPEGTGHVSLEGLADKLVGPEEATA